MSRCAATTSAVLVAGLLVAFTLQAQGWRESYPREFEQAHTFFRDNHARIDSFAIAHGYNSTLLYSIVAPEAGHYLVSKDRIETSIVELFYVEMGSDHGNFSIGPFQMQPAFAERVEFYVRHFNVTGFSSILHNNTREGRALRVRQIGQLTGSLQYLCAFVTVVGKIHRIQDLNSREALALTATAYNHGFEKTGSELMEIRQRPTFPRFGTTKLRYQDMALEFFACYQSAR